MVNLDGQFKNNTKQQLVESISKMIPDMVIFDQLVESVVFICNQIRCIDSTIVLLGRRGTGKRFLLQICAKMAGIKFANNISEAIIGAIQYQKMVFV